jgi:XTP/dITP diphosphohydrolase
MRPQLLIATSNPHKLVEIRAALSQVPVALVSLEELSPYPEPLETGATFQENARLKALHYAARTGLVTLAEDSGLVIDALGGEPGVRSARFLGPTAAYSDRFAEIERRLSALPGTPRTARFVCAVAIVFDDRIVFETTDAIDGTIADAAVGTSGFGYDPIFYYPPYRATLAEVSHDAKLSVSHRGKAFRKVAEWLRHRHPVSRPGPL